MGDTIAISWVSLVISITAFIVASAQALQQFAASAEGYRRCQRGIMGLWAHKTHRTFTLSEFRFKVKFHSPVIFVAPPGNLRGALEKAPIHNVTGTTRSYTDTYCVHPADQDAQNRGKEIGLPRIMRVHTTDDELASWVRLLHSLQKAEAEGRQWDFERSQSSSDSKMIEPVDSTLVVQLQERHREWDEMPDGIQKPFATTNISHIVEMATMLGMIWRTFDQDSWTLRAEGNGYMLLSQTVWGLGVSVAFSVTGKATFKSNRVIPCPGLKDMVFGTVTTIIPDLELHYEPMPKGSDSDWESLQTTQRTLRRLGCGRRDIRRYFTRRNHIRSVNFELIAMLAPVFRLRGSHFTRMPNPTPDPWIRSLSAYTLMHEFHRSLDRLVLKSNVNSTEQTTWIQGIWQDQLQPLCNPPEDGQVGLSLLEAVHDAVDQIDEYIKHFRGGTAVVRDVVGLHLMVVLEDLNRGEAERSFLATSECDTEEELIDHYFSEILPRIIELAVHPELASPKVRQRKGQAQNQPQSQSQSQSQRQSSEQHRSAVSSAASVATMQQQQQQEQEQQQTSGHAVTNVTAQQLRGPRAASLAGLDWQDLHDLWITLMFRMCCWWILHDFDETDVMVVPPRLKGSRLPVFIL